jgi:hypothetical protein
MKRDCNSLVAWYFSRQEQMAPFLVYLFLCIPSVCKDRVQVRGRSSLWEVSSERQDFISNEVQPNGLRLDAVEKINGNGFFDVRPQLFPGIALGEYVLCQTFSRIAALSFFGDLED